jgi:sarcosine reductase
MLEIGTFPVKDMAFGSHTHWQDGVLEMDREEVLGLLLADPHIRQASADIVRPGESVRVVNYTDIIEPKVKVDGPGMVYPGVCGRPTTRVGQGRTSRLEGCAVVECVDMRGLSEAERYYPVRRQTGSPDPFFDMSGPGAVTPYASLFNLCLTMAAPQGLNAEDRHRVLHSATLRVADRLAQTVVGLEPPDVEVFNLTPQPDLPGAVFIPHLSSSEWVTGSRSSIGMAVYGQPRLSAPWLLDGTEMLDGAVSQVHTWMLANNPLVLEMCRRHGTTFNFKGCIIQRTNWTMQVEKEMAAERAAHLAAMVDAEAAIITTDIRGQRYVETILTLQACERAGIKTVLCSEEEDPEDGNAPPFLVSPPELKAVVSTGTGAVPNPFPPVERVVGAVPKAEDRWYGNQPPIPGRYGARHAQDIYGYGKQSLADF